MKMHIPPEYEYLFDGSTLIFSEEEKIIYSYFYQMEEARLQSNKQFLLSLAISIIAFIVSFLRTK